MNTTILLPELDASSFWHDDSGLNGIYDIDHLIKYLRCDVRIVESIIKICQNGEPKKITTHHN